MDGLGQMDVRKGTTKELREINRSRIFQLIYDKKMVSRQEIAEQLFLSLPTVNQYLKELIDRKLITYSGNYESTGGRKPQIITLNESAKTAIGLSITKNSIRIAAVDLYGCVIANEKISLLFRNEDAYGKSLAELVQQFLDQTGIQEKQVLGVGFAIPGIFYHGSERIETAPSLDAGSFPVEMLTKYIKYKAIADNDANAGLYAECFRSREKKDVVYLLLEKGVGGALLLEDKIYRGDHGRASEFGHMTLIPDGKLCRCGRKGCVEAYLSTARLTDDFGCSLETFFDELRMGNKPFKDAFDEYISYFCTTISNLKTGFDCDVIAGGLITQYMGEYEEEIRRLLLTVTPFERDTRYFILTKYKSSAPAAGIAQQLVQTFLDNI